MPAKHDYVAIVGEAERAVAGVKDPELRRAAFEKILENLLGGAGPVAAKTVPDSAPKSAKKPAPAGSKTKGGPQAYVEELIGDGFFKKPKTIAEVKAELANRGHHIVVTSLSGPLQKLCQRKLLRRQKIKGEGKKQTYNYSNW